MSASKSTMYDVRLRVGKYGNISQIENQSLIVYYFFIELRSSELCADMHSSQPHSVFMHWVQLQSDARDLLPFLPLLFSSSNRQWWHRISASVENTCLNFNLIFFYYLFICCCFYFQYFHIVLNNFRIFIRKCGNKLACFNKIFFSSSSYCRWICLLIFCLFLFILIINSYSFFHFF